MTVSDLPRRPQPEPGPGALGVPVSVVVTLVRGFVMSRLWGWFAVPAFGAPPVGWAAASGLLLVWATLASYMRPSAEPDGGRMDLREVIVGASANVGIAGLTLLFGWLLQLL